MTVSLAMYENEATAASENANRLGIQRVLGGVLVKLPIQYGLDWGLVNPARSDAVERWVELKARSNPCAAYSTYSLSMMKVQRALQLEALTKIPALLVVRFSDGVYTTYFKRFMEAPITIRMGGRADRGDGQDIEPMWHLPIDKMQRLMDAIPGGEAVKVTTMGTKADDPL